MIFSRTTHKKKKKSKSVKNLHVTSQCTENCCRTGWISILNPSLCLSFPNDITIFDVNWPSLKSALCMLNVLWQQKLFRNGVSPSVWCGGSLQSPFRASPPKWLRTPAATSSSRGPTLASPSPVESRASQCQSTGKPRASLCCVLSIPWLGTCCAVVLFDYTTENR